LRKFRPENAPKAFDCRAPPGHAGEAFNASPDLLAGFKSGDRDKRMRKGKTQEGVWTAEGGEQRKQRRGGEGEEGRKRGGEKGRRNLAPTVISESRRL